MLSEINNSALPQCAPLVQSGGRMTSFVSVVGSNFLIFVVILKPVVTKTSIFPQSERTNILENLSGSQLHFWQCVTNLIKRDHCAPFMFRSISLSVEPGFQIVPFISLFAFVSSNRHVARNHPTSKGTTTVYSFFFGTFHQQQHDRERRGGNTKRKSTNSRHWGSILRGRIRTKSINIFSSWVAQERIARRPF